MRFAFIAVLCTSILQAGEYAVLATGFRLYADRHEVEGGVVRLFTRDGVTEMDRSRIVSFEAEETTSQADTRTPAPMAEAEPAPRSTREIIEEAARRNGIPEQFVHSVVAAESAYRADAVSPKGAIGLMQLMPDTARTYRADPRDPEQNVAAGVAYLRDLLVQYNGDTALALAAYNAGPGAVKRYNGVPPYPETLNYVYRVIQRYKDALNSDR